jgi:hypothetical protein
VRALGGVLYFMAEVTSRAMILGGSIGNASNAAGGLIPFRFMKKVA